MKWDAINNGNFQIVVSLLYANYPKIVFFHANILSQTYNATLFLFDYFYVNAHALSKLFHSINSSLHQASNLQEIDVRLSNSAS